MQRTDKPPQLPLLAADLLSEPGAYLLPEEKQATPSSCLQGWVKMGVIQSLEKGITQFPKYKWRGALSMPIWAVTQLG